MTRCRELKGKGERRKEGGRVELDVFLLALLLLLVILRRIRDEGKKGLTSLRDDLTS